MNPAFRALEKVLAALTPLNPEDRRKVIEAVHVLLPVSSGCDQDQDQDAPVEAALVKPARKRKGR